MLLPLTRWKKLQNEWSLVFLALLVQKLWSLQDIFQILTFKKAVDFHYLKIESISSNDCHFQTNWARNLSNHSDESKFPKVYKSKNHLLIILKILQPAASKKRPNLKSQLLFMSFAIIQLRWNSNANTKRAVCNWGLLVKMPPRSAAPQTETALHAFRKQVQVWK